MSIEILNNIRSSIFNEKKRMVSGINFFFFLLLIGACKKEKVPKNQSDEILSSITGTRVQFTLDSIFLYAKQLYLWNDAIPGYNQFSPREKYVDFSSELVAFRQELFDISQLKINNNTGEPFEISSYGKSKYSYLEPGRNSFGIMQAGSVGTNGVIASNIIQSGSNTIAYIALSSFPRLGNIKSKLDEVFTQLALLHPKYLVIDLRNNGGGFIETAEYIANLIVPSSLTGKVMYTEQFNTLLQDGKGSILKNQPYLDENGSTVIYKGRTATLADVDYTEKANTYKFNKKGNLESIESIYVIVSEKTASASELLISCLKPYINISLVGEHTYGKPVGFFGINIDQYTIYLSSFLIKNSKGWSDYFTGIEPDILVVSDTNPILGDPNELCLSAAISAINQNAGTSVSEIIVRMETSRFFRVNEQSKAVNIGSIENRMKLKY